MAEQDVELVREAIETLDRGEIEGMFDRMDPDFEIQVPPELSAEPDTYRGAEGVRRYFQGFEGVMKDVRFEAEEFIDAGGGNIVVPIRFSARSVSTDLAAEQRVVQVWTLRAGKLLRIAAYPTREDALAAVGMTEG